MNQRIMAFWKYDLMPYYLCGEVTILHANNLCETVEYGKGYRMRYEFLLPYEDGVSLRDKLKIIMEEQSDHIDSINQLTKERIKRQIDKYAGDGK